MKRISFFYSTMSFALILFLAVSCTKQGTPVSYTTHSFKQPVTSASDILIDDWASVNGGYVSTFTLPQHVLAVYVVNENQLQELSTNPIDYLGGKLWLNTYGNEAVLSYHNDFGEKPLKLNSTLIEIKTGE